MTAPAPQKLSNIQALRGLAALLVVFSHLPGMEFKHSSDMYLPGFFHLGITGVDLFFVISGFIMIYISRDVGPSVRNSFKFMFARTTRIYPLYWFVAFVLFVGWSLRPDLISFDPAEGALWRSFLLWPDDAYPMLKVAWTLIHELYFYAIFAFILLLPKALRWPALWIWIAGVIIGNRLGWNVGTPEAALIFHALTVEFFLGALAAWVYLKSAGRAAVPVLVIGCAALIAGWCIFGPGVDITNPQSFPTNWERVIYFGLPSALIVYGLVAVEPHFQMPKWSVHLGDWSYSLYLSHIMSMAVIGYVWRKFTLPGPIDNVVAFVLMVIGAVLAAYVTWRLIEKPALDIAYGLRRRFFP